MPFHATVSINGTKAEVANAADGAPAAGFVTVSVGDTFANGAFQQVSGPVSTAVQAALQNMLDGRIAPPGCTFPVYGAKSDGVAAANGTAVATGSVTVSMNAADGADFVGGKSVQLLERTQDILGAIGEDIVNSTPV